MTDSALLKDWESKDVAEMQHRHLFLHQGDDEDAEFYDHDDDEDDFDNSDTSVRGRRQRKS